MAKGRIVNKADIAELHGVSLPTVSAWVRRGCPFEQKGARGKEWLFNTAAVAEWREEQAALAAVGDTSALDIDEAKRRKMAAEAALVELDLAKRRGELVEIETIAGVVGEEYTRIRARLLSLPVKLAPLMETASGLQERRETIEDAISECLAELSADTEFGGDAEAGTEDTPEEADTTA